MHACLDRAHRHQRIEPSRIRRCPRRILTMLRSLALTTPLIAVLACTAVFAPTSWTQENRAQANQAGDAAAAPSQLMPLPPVSPSDQARQLVQSGKAGQPQLVILDTDVGDDIDDAYALAFALQSPELRILGITTAYGNTELRARLVDRFLRAVGQGLPVAAGVSAPQSNVFTQAAYAEQAPAHPHPDGVQFLLEQIHQHPGQITLVAIGPETNLQAALARDPATFRQLKQIVLMGGSVDRGYDDRTTGARRPPSAEWNIKAAPQAARDIFNSGVPLVVLPLDSTQIRLDPKRREAIFAHGSPLTDQLTLLYHQWAARNTWMQPDPALPSPTLFDPVTIAWLIRSDLCPTTPIRLEVDSRGFTIRVAGQSNAQVCLQADESGFLDLLESRLVVRKLPVR